MGRKQETPPPPPSTAPTPHALPAPPAPVRVMFVGDSNGVLIGEQFWKTTKDGGEFVTANEAKLGCGFDHTAETFYRDGRWRSGAGACKAWPEEYPPILEDFQPDVTVTMFGAWEIYTKRVEGRELPVLSPEWDAHMLGEMQALVDLLASNGGRVVVLTVPCFRFDERDNGTLPEEADPQRVVHMNELWREIERRNAPRVVVADLFAKVCPGGQYTDWLGDVYLRGDGQHFTEPALDLLTAWLAPQIQAVGSKAQYVRGQATAAATPSA